MKEFKAIEDDLPIYWEGNRNILIRFWTYIKVGLNLINDYKYVGAAVFGVYYTLKLNNWLWLVLMFIITLPLLLFIGRWWLHKGAKTSEFIVNQKGTVLGYQVYNAQIEIIKLLKEIRDKK
jgi:hypothetical protein